jgi:hypothetical protein
MAAVCEMCGQVWQGVTLGKMFHCRPRKALKRKEKKRDAVKQINKGERRCECGQLATVYDAWSTPICVGCEEKEKINQRNFSNSSGCNSATYSVRMPKWGKES